ncbi:MAG: hypothetical protein IJE84_05340, partial [Clostridia bacterium]|nr:hypothetical protein [Clostridia bacterium]
MKNNNKSILTLIACTVALFIPTYIAIAAYMAGPAEEYEIAQKEITSLVVTDIKGAEFSYTKEADKDVIAAVSAMLDNSTGVSALTDSTRNTPAYTIKTTCAEGERSYRFYFSTEGPSFYEDSNGNPYGITEDSCKAFFGLDCAVSLFYKTQAPILKNTFGDPIIPKEMTWMYTDYEGQYAPVSVSTTSEEKKYSLDGAFAFTFDVTPDFT